MSKLAAHTKSIRRAALVALAVLAVVGASAAPASAAQLMTLRGKVVANGYPQPGAKVYPYVWTGTAWSRGAAVTTDRTGSYALVVARQRYYVLQAVLVIGTQCRPWGGIYRLDGMTNVFYTDLSWHNPTYINVAVTPTLVC